MNHQSWFSSWFDTPYYHILYKNRNDDEAQQFLRTLLRHLNPAPDCQILDLACGKGRHSLFLSSLGFRVTGLDLSPESIASASKFSNDHLQFAVNDMREIYKKEAFDIVLNLFTSFGYFDDPEDDLRVLRAIEGSLVPQGRFVIDFMNAEKVKRELVPLEVKEVDGVAFHIERRIENGFVRKEIRFQADGKPHSYHEQVRLYGIDDFNRMLQICGLQPTEFYGSYQLDEFSQNNDRLIIIGKK